MTKVREQNETPASVIDSYTEVHATILPPAAVYVLETAAQQIRAGAALSLYRTEVLAELEQRRMRASDTGGRNIAAKKFASSNHRPRHPPNGEIRLQDLNTPRPNAAPRSPSRPRRRTSSRTSASAFGRAPATHGALPYSSCCRLRRRVSTALRAAARRLRVRAASTPAVFIRPL
jgi:hypothetical protein